MAYSKDFKLRVIEYYGEKGLTKTLEVFKIATETLYKWVDQYIMTGNLENKKWECKQRKINLEELEKYISKPENAEKFLYEIAKDFNCSGEGIRKALKKIGYTNKKNYKIQRTECRKS